MTDSIYVHREYVSRLNPVVGDGNGDDPLADGKHKQTNIACPTD